MTAEQPTSTDRSAGDTDPDIEQLQADIERTRADLGDTVDALSTRLDVKAQAKARLTGARDRAAGSLRTARARASELTTSTSRQTTGDGSPEPAVLAAVGAAAAVLAAVGAAIRWRARRRTPAVLDRVRGR